MAADTAPRYKGRWRFRFLERGTQWVLGITMVVGLALSAWGFAILSDNPSTPWPLDDPLTTAFGLVVTATINGDPDPVPWQLAVGRLIVPAALAGFTYSAYLSVTLVRQNIRAAERAREHTLVFGPAERVGQFLTDEIAPDRYLVHLDTGDEPVDRQAIYVEVEPDPFTYRAEFGGTQRRRRMDADLPLWAVAGAARDAQQVVVATGSDAVALSALGGLVAALGDATPLDADRGREPVRRDQQVDRPGDRSSGPTDRRRLS